MLYYFKGLREAKKHFHFAHDLYLRLSQYFYDRGSEGIVADILFLFEQSYYFTCFCFTLKHWKASIGKSEFTGVIFVLSLDNLCSNLQQTLIKGGANEHETDTLINDFKEQLLEGQKIWQQEIWDTIKTFVNNDPHELVKYVLPENLENTIDFVINRMNKDIELYKETSMLDFPPDTLKWLQRIIKSQLVKHNLLKELSIDLSKL